VIVRSLAVVFVRSRGLARDPRWCSPSRLRDQRRTPSGGAFRLSRRSGARRTISSGPSASRDDRGLGDRLRPAPGYVYVDPAERFVERGLQLERGGGFSARSPFRGEASAKAILSFAFLGSPVRACASSSKRSCRTRLRRCRSFLSTRLARRY